MEEIVDQETLYPLEFYLVATPISLGASASSRERWKAKIREAARDRVRETDELGFLDRRPLALMIFYFPAARMEGDVDNIVKPIMDALISVAYLDDKHVERVLVQKFEPDQDWSLDNPSEQLTVALNVGRPMLYVRVDDDLRWRRLP